MASLRDIMSDPQASARLGGGLIDISGGGAHSIHVGRGREVYIVQAKPLRKYVNRVVVKCTLQ